MNACSLQRDAIRYLRLIIISNWSISSVTVYGLRFLEHVIVQLLLKDDNFLNSHGKGAKLRYNCMVYDEKSLWKVMNVGKINFSESNS